MGREYEMKLKDLNENFYTNPEIANTVMDSKNLKELLLDSAGKVLTCGRLRDIKSKHIGAGVYRVTLDCTK